MDVKIGMRIHNRFDVEVRDIRTGKIEEEYKGVYAENIVLDNYFDYLIRSSSDILNRLHYGRGTGVLSATRTTLFDKINHLTATETEVKTQFPPLVSYRKVKAVILSDEAVGETITEVGISNSTSYILNHAMLKDSEGNQISIGPKTDLQEITIYSTIFAETILPTGVDFVIYNNVNLLAGIMIGASKTSDITSTSYIRLYTTTNKEPTINVPTGISQFPQTGSTGASLTYKPAGFNVNNAATRERSTPRIRFASSESNGKVWAMDVFFTSYTIRYPLFRIYIPDFKPEGYFSENIAIGVGDGETKKFISPWSDIDDSKAYKFYKDGVLQIEGTDYTFANSENETSITFANAPADTLPITGDIYTQYIPKDDKKILDVTMTIVFNEGV